MEETLNYKVYLTTGASINKVPGGGISFQPSYGNGWIRFGGYLKLLSY